MKNVYKISSIVLIIVLSFFAVRASLQEKDTSGDTGTTMDRVESQDGVSLDGRQSSLEGVENSGLSVGEAGQVGLTLGEAETPTFLEDGLLGDDNGSGQSLPRTGFGDDKGVPSLLGLKTQQVADSSQSNGVPGLPGGTKDYWLYIRTYDKPEVTMGQTGGRSKKGDMVQVLDASIYTTPSEIEKKEWLIVKVSGLTQSQIDLMMKPWIENTESPDKGRTGRGSTESKTETIGGKKEKREITKAYRKYKVDIDDLKNQENINIDKGLWKNKIDKSDITNKLQQKDKNDISRYYWQSVRYALANNISKFTLKLAHLVVQKARATTTNTFTVIPAGGGDYASLSLWEDARDGNLVTLDYIEIANCSGATADTTAVTIDGWTTNATHYIEINGDNTSGKWDTAKYRLAPSSDGYCITLNDNYITVNALQLYPLGSAAASGGISTGNINITIKNCIIDGHQDSLTSTGIYAINCTDSLIYRNVIYGFYRGGFDSGIIHNGGTGVVIACNTVYDIGGDYGYGIRERSSADSEAKVVNNAVFNCSYRNFDTDTGNYGANSGYNCTNSETAPGENNQVSKTASNQFVSLTNGSEDFHLKVGADCIDTGTNLGSPYDYDIDNVQVTGTWDIGADEYISTAPTYHPRPPASGTGTGPAMY